MLQYGLLVLATRLAQALPLRWCYTAADLAADLTFAVWRRGRSNMLDNMAHVLGPGASPAEVRGVAQQALRNYCRTVVDFLRAPGQPIAEVAQRIEFDDWGPLEQARAGGKGSIYVALHMGNWDLGGLLLASHGFVANVVVDTFSNPRVDKFVEESRHGWGLKTIPYAQAARRVLQALRRGEGLGLLMDRPLLPDERGVAVRFFGALAYIPAGAATLSLRTGAPIVPMGMVRLPDDSFLAFVEQCIFPKATGDLEEDVRALTQQIMDKLAAWVQRHPDQWFMFRRMWSESVGEPQPTGDARPTASLS